MVVKHRISSAMDGLDPHRVVCYLPSRYCLYAVYAAVLHKADCAGAFQSDDQRKEITSLAREFVSWLEKGPSTEVHICHSHSRMLKQLWIARQRKTNLSSTHMPASTNIYRDHPHRPIARDPERSTPCYSFTPSRFFDSLPREDETAAFPSIEDYLLGSFMPGVADFSTPGSEGQLVQQYPFGEGVQDWGLYQDGTNSHGPM